MKRRFANAINNGNIDYQQKYVNTPTFQGYISLVKIKEVQNPLIVNNGEKMVCIINTDYTWLELYPEKGNFALTIMFDEKGKLIEWYFDIAKNIGLENNIPYEDDLFLDLVVEPSGKIHILDKEELEIALENQIITQDDFNLANNVLSELQLKFVKHKYALKDLTCFACKTFGIFESVNVYEK